MYFHAVEARSLGVFRTDAIGLDDVTDFLPVPARAGSVAG
ncbi:hypothetical protein ALP33_102863 [Pseudomonas amygdali pv. lachrymans]|uniref:Uncharacterized protein n=1 Tax=Pseudomonas amygdali pv. lachrymans TaxID=53707 RepID=A0AB37R9P9_PSEAV|nr:Unknown protein sequence [Pseudomonas amygdali pv. lachrymans]KPC13668.1 Unknown protein sequence [Pseudomonas amygdali pv. lachrymans]RMM37539.1 hypothetical protein ALQ79_102879 [Pseudomonas amygdali pv. lachrymans]RMP28436.1 hypothetical protein ALQ26_103322 [Pseudomonas amygdali pv. lachrymans]RMT19526.1 hypothetical protein ALP54_102819 [Pseudomonas amygdali pv. lachrymans]